MCADYAMETMPVELWNAIGNVPDPAGMLLQVFPEAAPHKAWFEKLVAEFFIEEDGKPDLEPAPDAAARPNYILQIPDGVEGTRETLKRIRDQVRRDKWNTWLRERRKRSAATLTEKTGMARL